MKQLIITALFLILPIMINAQESCPFKGKIYNDEYQVWIEMDFYDNDISVPGQAIFGKLPGYFGAKRDSRKWLITDAEISGNTASISIINDYGSEDLTATLTQKSDGSYIFEQKRGSTLKIAVNRKWVKLPKKLVFTLKSDK